MIIVILTVLALVVLVATDTDGGSDGPKDDDSAQAGESTLPILRVDRRVEFHAS